MWNLEKWYKWTYLQSRNRDTDVENEHMNTREESGSEMNMVIGIDIYTLLCLKQIFNVTLMYNTGNSTALNGKETWKKGDVCVHIADPLCSRAETNTTL